MSYPQNSSEPSCERVPVGPGTSPHSLCLTWGVQLPRTALTSGLFRCTKHSRGLPCQVYSYATPCVTQGYARRAHRTRHRAVGTEWEEGQSQSSNGRRLGPRYNELAPSSPWPIRSGSRYRVCFVLGLWALGRDGRLLHKPFIQFMPHWGMAGCSQS